MGRPREFDAGEALSAALETFWERGYEGTSLSDLTERMGLQKGSLYSAFGDKRRLFLAALAHYQDAAQGEIAAELAHGSPRAALRRFFAGVVERATSRDGGRGCLCVNTAVELAPHDEEIARAVQRHTERLEGLFRDALERGQARGELARGLDPRAGGRFLAALLLGLAVLAKIRPGRARLEDAVRVALGALDP